MRFAPRTSQTAILLNLVVLCLLLVLLCLLLGSCGASARQRFVQVSLTSLNTARDGFVEYDAQAQQAIVELATSLDDGQAKLAAYRAKRGVVIKLFEGAYRALATAAVMDDANSAANLAASMLRLNEALEKLRVVNP